MEPLAFAMTSVISYILPFDYYINMQISLMLNELIRFIITKLPKFATKYKNNTVIIYKDLDGKINTVYQQLEEYMATYYLDKISLTSLVPLRGEISISLDHGQTREPIEIDYNKHKIKLQLGQHKVSENQTITGIIVSSKTCNSKIMQEFVQSVCKETKHITNIIKVYMANVECKKDEQYIIWKKTYVKTNKTTENTIYSEKVQRELFDKVEYFINNEIEYAKFGLVYTYGALLYGEPGTGKTTISKIFANKYNLPIASIKLDIIKYNMTEAMMDLRYMLNNEKYILLIDDAEKQFDFGARYHDDNKIIGELLNMLDGVVEPYGRILFMCVNDKSDIVQHKALIRHGRINDIINIGLCDVDQTIKIFKLFYSDLSLEQIEKLSNATPYPASTLTNILINVKDIDKIIEFVTGNASIKASIIEIIPTIKSAMESTKCTIVKNKHDIYITKKLRILKKLKKQLKTLETTYASYNKKKTTLVRKIINEKRILTNHREKRKIEKRKEINNIV